MKSNFEYAAEVDKVLEDLPPETKLKILQVNLAHVQHEINENLQAEYLRKMFLRIEEEADKMTDWSKISMKGKGH